MLNGNLEFQMMTFTYLVIKLLILMSDLVGNIIHSPLTALTHINMFSDHLQGHLITF